jgi:hypothetical protein
VSRENAFDVRVNDREEMHGCVGEILNKIGVEIVGRF